MGEGKMEKWKNVNECQGNVICGQYLGNVTFYGCCFHEINEWCNKVNDNKKRRAGGDYAKA